MQLYIYFFNSTAKTTWYCNCTLLHKQILLSELIEHAGSTFGFGSFSDGQVGLFSQVAVQYEKKTEGMNGGTRKWGKGRGGGVSDFICLRLPDSNFDVWGGEELSEGFYTAR